jgi:hypothetical protein
MAANSPSRGSAKPLPSSLPGPMKAEDSSAPSRRSVVRAASDSRNSGNSWVDERYLPAGIPGWAQSSRGAGLELIIETLTNLAEGRGGCFGARHPIFSRSSFMMWP